MKSRLCEIWVVARKPVSNHIAFFFPISFLFNLFLFSINMELFTDDMELVYHLNEHTIYTNRFYPITIKEAEKILTSHEFEEETTTTIPFRPKGICYI